MFDLSKSTDYQDLNKESILNKIDQFQIFEYYFGEPIDLNKKYKNPLRKDENPGCSFYMNKKGVLLFKDFALSEPAMDCFNFVKKLYNVNYFGALKYINSDMNLKLGYASYDTSNGIKKKHIPKKREREICSNVDIKVLPRRFTNIDMKYWSSYNITLETLKKFQVYSISHVYKNGEVLFTYSPSHPIFCYKFSNGSKKIYRPKSEIKFISVGPVKDVYQGYEMLPDNGDILIITKSMKDVMCLYELKYNAIAPNGEGYIISPEIMEDLKSRFKHIILLYDNDETGIANSKLIAETYGIEWVILPMEKDISDYIHKFSVKDAKHLLDLIIFNVIYGRNFEKEHG